MVPSRSHGRAACVCESDAGFLGLELLFVTCGRGLSAQCVSSSSSALPLFSSHQDGGPSDPHPTRGANPFLRCHVRHVGKRRHRRGKGKFDWVTPGGSVPFYPPPFGEEGKTLGHPPPPRMDRSTRRHATPEGEGRSSARRERVGPRFPLLGRGTGRVDAGRAVEDPFRGGGGGGDPPPSRSSFSCLVPPPSTLPLDPEMNRGYPPDHRPFFVSFSQGHEKGGRDSV
eukprot:scaffold1949_cov348-Pavlova_lutheri.AAC.22